MTLIKTKDIRTVLYSIAKQLKSNDKFKIIVATSWTSELQLNESTEKNEIAVIKTLAIIRRILSTGKDVSIFINEARICNISKISQDEYLIEDWYAQLIEIIFFELIGEANKIKVEFAKENESEKNEIAYIIDATYSRDHIINTENVYDTFCDISKSLNEKLMTSIVAEKEYNVTVTSKFIRPDSEYVIHCNINFEFKITM